MSEKNCILYLVEENQKLKKENELLKNKLKENLLKSADLMTKTIDIKAKVDFYEGLNYLSDDDYGKGFNKAFQIVQRLFNTKNIKE